jgi:hypothetical protein
MNAPIHGRLLQGSSAPRSGELTDQLAEMSGVVIEQILSGEIDQPVDHNQDTP